MRYQVGKEVAIHSVHNQAAVTHCTFATRSYWVLIGYTFATRSCWLLIDYTLTTLSVLGADWIGWQLEQCASARDGTPTIHQENAAAEEHPAGR